MGEILEMPDIKAKNLLKRREIRIEDGVVIKKRRPDELEVESTVLNFLKDDPNFHVPKIVDDKVAEDEIATEYIPGMQVTRFFHLLNIINNYALGIRQSKQRLLELKMAVVNEMLGDLSYFQSRNCELLDALGNHCGQYQYLDKLDESFDVAVDCFRRFGYNPGIGELRSVAKELEELAGFLAGEAKFVFRDAITDNVILKEPGLDNVSDDEAVGFILVKLAEPSGIEHFRGQLYHVDFGTANHLVTRVDDVVHILEHEMCSLEGIVPSGKCAEVSKDELYYSTVVARMFRSWSRRCVYLVGRMVGREDRYPNEHPEFYLNKVVGALMQLRSKDGTKHFEHLCLFCSESLNKGLITS